MPTRAESVDQYLESGCGRCERGGTPQCKVRAWVDELRLLREILQQSTLVEEAKWGAPCYTHHGKNVLMLSALNDSVVVSFFQGAQLKDPVGILEKPGESSRFARYLRFTDRQGVEQRQGDILAYVAEAAEIAKSGNSLEPAVTDLPEYPQELVDVFGGDPGFEAAFTALTPGRQRGYLIHFSSAKQSATRAARIDRQMPKIFAGKGWNER